MHFPITAIPQINAPDVATGAPVMVPGPNVMAGGQPLIRATNVPVQLQGFGADPALAGGLPRWAKALIVISIIGAAVFAGFHFFKKH